MTPEQHYESWVRQCGGDRVIKRILIANNGMAAAKFILSIRNFLFQSFGDDQLIHIIAMATPEDMKASAKHLHLANAYYEVPGGPNFNNYANVSVITSMAQLHSCDAVWPGWGHASEIPALPRTCEEMGIVFICPTVRSMFLLVDKIEHDRRAERRRSVPRGLARASRWRNERRADRRRRRDLRRAASTRRRRPWKWRSASATRS